MRQLDAVKVYIISTKSRLDFRITRGGNKHDNFVKWLKTARDKLPGAASMTYHTPQIGSSKVWNVEHATRCSKDQSQLPQRVPGCRLALCILSILTLTIS